LTSSFGEVIHLFRQRQTPAEIAAVSFVDNVAYLLAANGGMVIVIRNGVATPIVKSEESEVKSASGFIKEVDILLLSTLDITNIVNIDRLQHNLQSVSDVSELKE